MYILFKHSVCNNVVRHHWANIWGSVISKEISVLVQLSKGVVKLRTKESRLLECFLLGKNFWTAISCSYGEVISDWLVGFSNFSRKYPFPLKTCCQGCGVACDNIFSVLSSKTIDTNNGKNLGTIWKAISCSYVMVISGYLVRVSEFHRNLRFGSKRADRVVNLLKKAYLLNVPYFMFCRL